MSDDSLTTDTSELKTVKFPAGTILFNENDHSYQFYIIQDGEVQIYKTDDDGNEVVLTTVTQGASLGEFAMIDKRPRSATARAISDVTAIEVSEAAYHQLLTELPDWAIAVMKAMVERLRTTNEIIRRPKILTPQIRLEILSAEYDTAIRKVENNERDPFDDEETPDLA